jgi:ribonuclease P protein component
MNGNKISSLSKNEDFRFLLKGKKISNKYFTIFFDKILNKDNKNLNISFVVKKKIGNAVKRNKIKRRLKNIMIEAIKKISLNLNYSYLIIAKKTVLNDNYMDIKETLFSNFKKIR